MKKIMIAIVMVICAASFCLAGEQKAPPTPAPQPSNVTTVQQADTVKKAPDMTTMKKTGKESKKKNKRAKSATKQQ